MRLAISRQNLARVLGAVGKVVESRNTIPILGNVLLDASDRLHVTGTDLDITATASVEADVSELGRVCVDVKLLSDIVKKAGADDVYLGTEGDKLIVKSGRSRFTLQTLPAEDFPDLKGGAYTSEFDIDLAALFSQVAFAMSNEETRYYLNGVFIHPLAGNIVAVATDGHRLSRRVGPIVPDFPSVIVPRKTVGLIPHGTVKLSVSEAKIRVVAGDFVLTSKLIDGTFPDYQRVIPSMNDKIVVVERDALTKAVDRVSTVSSEKGRAVKLSIAPGSIALHVSNPDSGSADDEITADYSGEPIDIGFNSLYVRDVFGTLPPGQVTIALNDSGSPALITGGADGLTLVLMPMRV